MGSILGVMLVAGIMMVAKVCFSSRTDAYASVTDVQRFSIDDHASDEEVDDVETFDETYVNGVDAAEEPSAATSAVLSGMKDAIGGPEDNSHGAAK